MRHLAYLFDELVSSIQQRHTIQLEALGLAFEGSSYLFLHDHLLLFTYSLSGVHGFAYLSWYLC